MKGSSAIVLCLGLCVLAVSSLPNPDALTNESEIGMAPGKYPKEMPIGTEWNPGNYTHPHKDAHIDLLPPKYYPGEMHKQTEFTKVDTMLDHVLRAGGIMQDRRCALGIANVADTQMINTRFWLYSGMIHSSNPPVIDVEHSGLQLYIKKDWELTGSVGVTVYDLDGTDYRLAVMWSVPFDWNIYKCWFNVKIYPRNIGVDNSMYKQMYYYAGPWRALGWESRNEYGIKITTSMTENIQSKIYVNVDTSSFSRTAPVERHAECSYHAGWVGKYCWRECHPLGWCWINKGCSSNTDCNNIDELPCYTGCKGP